MIPTQDPETGGKPQSSTTERTQTQEAIKKTSSTPLPADLKRRKDALVKGERAPARVFRMEKDANGTFSRVAVNPETQRRKSAKAWEAKSEVAKVRHSLDLTQQDFAALLGVGLSTLRSWEQKKRESSGAAKMLINIALKHPEVLQDAVA